MKNFKVESYLIKNKIATIPEIQKKFDLDYKEVRNFFSALVKRGKLVLMDELHFEYINQPNKIPEIYKKVLWECIQKEKVSFIDIQKKYELSPPAVKTIVKWMEDNGFVSSPPFNILLMTKEEFIERFGQIEEEIKEPDIQNSAPNSEALKKFLNAQREDLRKRIKKCEDEMAATSIDDLNIMYDNINNVIIFDDSKDEFENLSSKINLYIDKLDEDEIRPILNNTPNLKKDEFIRIIEDKLTLEKDLKTNKVGVYKRILERLKNMNEEDFQYLKNQLLSEEE